MRTQEQIKDFIFINRHLMTKAEMADELGIGRYAVQNICVANEWETLKQTDRHKEFILANKKLTVEEVAEILNMTYQSVWRLNKELGSPLLTNEQKRLASPKPTLRKAGNRETEKEFTPEEKEIYLSIAAEVVAGMTKEEKERFAKKYVIRHESKYQL